MTSNDRHIQRSLVFLTSNPVKEVHGHVDLEQILHGVPSWSMQTMNLGPLRSSPSYMQHLRDTVGSSYDWSDELRFDKRTGRLASFVLKLPESGQVDAAVAQAWLELPGQLGIPVIEERENGFHIDPLDLRSLVEGENALMAVDARLPLPDCSSLRLTVAQDVDFLFHENRYCGWVLRNPLTYLVAEPGDPIPGGDDPRVHDLLREYISVVVEPNIARMSDEDPVMRAALRSLYDRVRACNAVQARALEKAVARLLEIFYPE